MNTKIENPATCEIRSVIRFLNAKNIGLAKIHALVVEEYGEGALIEWKVRKWCRLLKQGRTNFHDKEKKRACEQFKWEFSEHPH